MSPSVETIEAHDETLPLEAALLHCSETFIPPCRRSRPTFHLQIHIDWNSSSISQFSPVFHAMCVDIYISQNCFCRKCTKLLRTNFNFAPIYRSSRRHINMCCHLQPEFRHISSIRVRKRAPCDFHFALSGWRHQVC